MLRAMTTIEFCEKNLGGKGGEEEGGSGRERSIYHLGFYGNICAVLGDNPLLWLFPFTQPTGDGLTFVTAQSPLRRDMEVNKGIKRPASSKPKAQQWRLTGAWGYGN